MKTTILTIALLFSSLIHKSQNENRRSNSPAHEYKIRESFGLTKLTPVYFNFGKRQLRDMDKNLISAIEFLNLCRTINDSAIQYQVARYDGFTKEKQKTGVVALGSGFSAIGLIGTASVAASNGQSSDVVTGSLAVFGVIGILMIPVCAIYSSVPHQKRKGVLFRDLPVAYNHFVETHQQ